MIRPRYVLSLAVALLSSLAGYTEIAQPKATAKEDYSQQAAIIEEMATKVSFENSGNFTREQTTRVRVQTDAGVKQWGVLSFPYQSATQTIEVDYMRVRKTDGSTIITPADNVQDLDSEITCAFWYQVERHAPFPKLPRKDELEID